MSILRVGGTYDITIHSFSYADSKRKCIEFFAFTKEPLRENLLKLQLKLHLKSITVIFIQIYFQYHHRSMLVETFIHK